MTHWKKRGLSLLLAIGAVLSLSAGAAASGNELDKTVADTAQYLCETVPRPRMDSVGGEWTVLGLARSDCAVPAGYFSGYYAALEETVRACGGVLHERKYTEYSRVILAVSALGKDARDVAGYDLTLPLGDYDKTIRQGLNGPIWALVALDCRNYPMPQVPEAGTQATRQTYVEYILENQLPGGGWSLTGGSQADPDLTGMALQALAKYREQPAVEQAVQAALTCMSGQQNASGGFRAWGTAGSESCAQMIVALCELGISLEDTRFVKNGNTLLDALMSFYQPGGGFRHTADGAGSDLMATEQGFYALTAARRAAAGQSSLYRMENVVTDREENTDLAGKHPDVTAQPIINPGKTFPDLSGNRTAIEALAARGILNGKDSGLFDPAASMTRAEFAAVMVRALGLPRQKTGQFTDVPEGAWYADYVGAACTYGIVTGTGAAAFTPEGIITRQEAAVMVARAARLCGLDTTVDPDGQEETLSAFRDGTDVASWAKESLAFCCRAGLLNQTAVDIRPEEAVGRGEIAQMVYDLLRIAELL